MKGKIVLSGVEVRFPRSNFDLSFRNLEIEPGHVTVITGPSGSGKSTLGHAAAGLLPYMGAAIKGKFRLGAITIPLADRKAWRGVRGRAVRWIPQEPARVFTTTLPLLPQMLEGIENPKAHADRLARLLDVTGLPNQNILKIRYPFELSGGMLQRAAVISAFLPAPALVVADEPTAHLDQPRSLLMARIVTALARHAEAAVLWITHDLRLAAAMAHRVIFLAGGRIESEGSPRDLLDPFGENPSPLVKASARLALPV